MQKIQKTNRALSFSMRFAKKMYSGSGDIRQKVSIVKLGPQSIAILSTEAAQRLQRLVLGDLDAYATRIASYAAH